MGKARSKVKRPKTFKYNTDRKKLWKKAKQLPSIQCDAIKAAWDPKKSTELNMKAMGLAASCNKVLSIAESKRLTNPKRARRSQKALSHDVTMEELNVADILEKQASAPGPPSGMKLSEPDAEFCMEMIEKYGEDYVAMAKDADNYYQETPKQIKRKVLTFRRFPGPHSEFLASKGIASAFINAMMETE